MGKTEALDYSYLDSRSLLDQYATGPDRNHMVFFVGAIKCSSCVRTLEALPEKLAGLLSLRVNLLNKTAQAEIDPSRTDFKYVADAMAAAGFTPVPLTSEFLESAEETKLRRRETIRLAVAGACAGNIMSFAFANYFGAAGEWHVLFAWLSFALYLPVVTFVAWPFYRGAYFALKNRQLSIDLPMAVASLAGFVFSTAELLRGRENIYYDSLAGFLFLILLSRWFQGRLQRRFLQPENILESLSLMRARRAQGSTWLWCPREQLTMGDVIVIREHETIPADCELADTSAYISLAFLTGESLPKTVRRGDQVPAGAKLLQRESRMIVKRPLEETAFGHLIRQTRDYSLRRSRSVHLSDKIAQWLLAVVFLTAIIFLAAYWPVSPEEAVRRALALIILVCPCAMAFGTPLAIASAISRAHRRGILVRDGSVFEAAAKTETVFLDKTGTLTDSELTLVEDPASISNSEQLTILALERNSAHPIANSFRRAFERSSPLEVQDWRETAGEGVEGKIGSHLYRLIRTKRPESSMACSLVRNGRELHTFHFHAKIKPDAKQALAQLRATGLKLKLLTGDSSEAAIKMALELGFDPLTEVQGNLLPGEKAQFVKAAPNSMMVGDGVNDAPALMCADVGVAVSGGVETAYRGAKVILTESNLTGIAELLQLSREARRSIRINLAVSLAYNSAGAVLALSGFINPYVAALLMPVSSGLILFTTWLRSRR